MQVECIKRLKSNAVDCSVYYNNTSVGVITLWNEEKKHSHKIENFTTLEHLEQYLRENKLSWNARFSE